MEEDARASDAWADQYEADLEARQFEAMLDQYEVDVDGAEWQSVLAEMMEITQ